MKRHSGNWILIASAFTVAVALSIASGPVKTVLGRQAQQATGPQLKITDFTVAIPAGSQNIEVTSVAKAVNVMTVNCAFGFSFFDKDGNALQVKTDATHTVQMLVKNINGVDASSGTVIENFSITGIKTVNGAGTHVSFYGVQASYNINSVTPAGAADVASAAAGTTPGPVVPPPGNGLTVTVDTLTGVTNLAAKSVSYTYAATAKGNPNATAPYSGNFQMTVTFLKKGGAQAGHVANYDFQKSSSDGKWTGGIVASSVVTFAKSTGTLLLTATDSTVPPNSGAGSKTSNN